jgi:hypothetical protein
MHDTHCDPGWINGQLFNENRNKFPADELRKYAGQHVAWNREGTRILAGDEDLPAAVAKLQAAGFHTGEVVWSWVPAAEVDSLLPSLQDAISENNGTPQ